MHPHRRFQRLTVTLLLAAGGMLAGPGTSPAGLLGIGADYTLYDINPANGAATNPRVVGNKVNSIAISPAGTLYGVSQGFPGDVPPGGNLFTILVASGFPTLVATMDTYVVVEGDIACDPTTGKLYGVSGPGDLFEINTTTAQGTAVGAVGTTLDLSAMAFDNAGNLHIVDSFGPTLLKVNKANAAVTATVPLDPVEQQVGGLAFDPGSGTLYYAGGIPSKLYTLDTTTGAAVLKGTIPVASGIWGLAWLPDPTPTRATTWGRIKALYR
jgi:hypothetical protein